MKLIIPPLGQQDGRWGDKTLGNTQTRIKTYGCLLVCHTMMLNYYGKNFTPDTLNAVYKDKGVFDGNLIMFAKVTEVFPDILSDERYNCEKIPCDLGKIDKYLRERKPVIAWVDLVDNDKKPDHFVLIIGKSDDGHYLINDPWTGETYFFDAKYGNPTEKIYGLRLYSGTPPNQGKSLEDEILDLQEKLRSANEMLAEKALEVNSLRDSLQSEKNKVGDLEEQLNKARSERDKADWEKTQTELKNKELESSLNAFKDKVCIEKEEYDRLTSKEVLRRFTKRQLLRYVLIGR
jgi:hypothetical protein